MLEGLIVSHLQRVLGRFFDGLGDGKQAKTSLWSGRLTLRDAKLRPDALYALGLPLSLRAGEVEELTIEIPWRHLGAEPMKVLIRGVSIVLASLDEDDDFSDEVLREWSWKRKQQELQSLVQHAALGEEAAALLQAAVGSSPPKRKKAPKKKKDDAVPKVPKFVVKMLDHLQITMENIHVRYEDFTHSRAPFAIGVMLSSVSNTCDSETKKTMKIAGLMVYHADVRRKEDGEPRSERDRDPEPEPQPGPEPGTSRAERPRWPGRSG